MQAKEQQNRNATRAILAPAISGLIELHDRIAAGLAAQPPAPSLAERLVPGAKRARQWLQGHLEGQMIIHGRILDLLESCGVSAMKTIGEQFDPNIMKAVGFAANPQRLNNTVLQENRQGFRQDERIVRFPEVIVNKQEA